MARAYLDWNATAPLRPEARAAMTQAMDVTGNPASVHAEGRAARALVEKAREQVAALVGAKRDEVIFTSGATEAARVLSLIGGAVVEPTSHDCLWAHHAPGEGMAPVAAFGLANSETGIVSAMPERDADGLWMLPWGGTARLLLVDAVQAAGRVPVAFGWSDADLMILSAHKLGGPKGVGALIVREGQDIPALSLGGGQESGRRSGTENTAGIAGFGAAAEAAMHDLDAGIWSRVEEFRNILENGIAATATQTIFVGKDVRRLANTACFAVPGWTGETQVMQMDLAGFAISAGSACSSGKVRESRVLRAMGYDDDVARSAIRVSLGPETREDEITRFVEAWSDRHRKFRAKAA
ncbi:cysteine desulfurase family protein [Anianabacter salinae]|uniref:cysteine desulfurase family protein n=1 Tax=Anianabacter salinae TaxID=2851023 RepID=UPI00225DD24D|nr:cysteine desulfurase family protein [Anianabacter salinae]MBV0912237.1 cysteine desulfurase [Anianabacter salinae]